MTRMRRRALALAGTGYLAALAINRSLVVVRGASMTPTLLPGDRLVTLPAVGRWLRPGRLVVLPDPHDADHLVVKRLWDLRDGTCEVRGDAPEHSTDSRTWGRIPVQRIRRVVLARLPGHPGRRATTSSSGSSSPTSPRSRRP